MDTNCTKCGRRLTGVDTFDLPCRHRTCGSCVDNIVAVKGKKFCLPCGDAGCNDLFDLVYPPDPRVSRKTHVVQHCVKSLYNEAIPLINTIPKPTNGKKIMGVGFITPSLFVVSRESDFVYEYDTTDTGRIVLPKKCAIEGLVWPRGLAVSARKNTVYVISWSSMFGGSVHIYRRDENTSTATRFAIQPFGIATSEASDGGVVRIFITCVTPGFGYERIYVYTDGINTLQPTATLTLPSFFHIPRHAIPVQGNGGSNYNFAVCHGWLRHQDHRVSLVSSIQGDCLEEHSAYGIGAGGDCQQLRRPLELLADSEGMLLVVDYYNDRIQLLTSRLQLVRHLLSSKDQPNFRRPRNACLDAERGLMFVGFEDGQVMIFSVCTPTPRANAVA